MRRSEIESLDPSRTWWVPAVVSPGRDWPGAAGSRRGGRYMVDCGTLRASRDEFEPFETRLGCLSWIMSHRSELNRTLPGAAIRAVRLDRWLLGLE